MIHKGPSEVEILRTLSDRASLKIISSVANGVMSASEFSNRKDLSSKQYYSRTAQMIKKGLIRRNKGHLFLTSLGKISYHSLLKIDYAIKNYWKLKAIESMQDSSELRRDERTRIIKTIIGNDKTILKIFENQSSSNRI
jgi:DNA-binding HxlR family transcriptional regulator